MPQSDKNTKLAAAVRESLKAVCDHPNYEGSEDLFRYASVIRDRLKLTRLTEAEQAFVEEETNRQIAEIVSKR